MTHRTLYRLSGVALLIGSLCAILGFLLHPSGDNPDNYLGFLWVPASLLILVGALLVALGLPGMYARQAARVGKLGFIGFLLTFVALVLFNVALGSIEALLFPALAANAATRSFLAGPPPGAYGSVVILALLLELIGPVLLGIATLRAHVFPRWIAWLLIIIPVFVLLGFFTQLPGPLAQPDALVLNLSMAGMGISLLTRQDPEQDQSVVTSPSL